MRKIVICSHYESENGICDKFGVACNNRAACDGKFGISSLICDCGHEVPLGKAYEGVFTCYTCGTKYDKDGNKFTK